MRYKQVKAEGVWYQRVNAYIVLASSEVFEDQHDIYMFECTSVYISDMYDAFINSNIYLCTRKTERGAKLRMDIIAEAMRMYI